MESPSFIIDLGSSTLTALKNQLYPLKVDYTFTKEFDLSEDLLPFIEYKILTEAYPDTESQNLVVFQPYKYGDDYYKILGDSTLIYQGFHPDYRQFSQEELDNGDFLLSHTSKWMYGNITYYDGGDFYNLTDGFVMGLTTQWDVVELPGYPGYYSYKLFECSAIDVLNGSYVTGTGTYTVNTAYESSPGVPANNTVVLQNHTMTAPMFHDFVSFSATGRLYKNNIYQTSYTFPFYISLIFSDTGLTFNNMNYNFNSYKLHYDANRANEFMFSTSTNVLDNIPHKIDYQSGNLPYGNITVEVNPTNYPLTVSDSKEYKESYQKQAWSKIDNNKYIFILSGRFYVISKATDITYDTAIYVLETYSESGNTYVRVAENRPGKQVPLYSAPKIPIKCRLIISFNNPLESHEIKK